MARLKGKLDLFGALRGVPPIEGPPLRDLKGQFVEGIVRPPLFSTLGGTICRMYRAPALFVRTRKECFALFSAKCTHSRTFFRDLCPLSHNTPLEVARGRRGAVQTGVLTAQPESAQNGPFES